MHSLGLVLSGGAARGAYEAGVLRYLYTDLPRRLGVPIRWPSVVSGTSVGALNGVFAVTQEVAAIHRLSELWRTITIDRVYRLRAGRTLLRALRRGGDFGLLDPAPLHGLLRSEFPGRAARRSIDSGRCRAFIVAATEVATGYNVVFVDTADPTVTVDAQPGARTWRTRIDDEHCRASAAIPFMFPPVSIDGRWHVDGGLRQNTPLRPVLRAGVDRMLVVGLKQPREEEPAIPEDAVPSLPFLLGKMLNALLLDPVERDLWQAEQVNKTLVTGAAVCGAAFEDRMREEHGLRRVDITYVRPTEDLGRVAGQMYRQRPPKATRGVRMLLDLVADRSSYEADFLSYLYFDRGFTAEIERLGWEDARRQEEQLATLFA